MPNENPNTPVSTGSPSETPHPTPAETPKTPVEAEESLYKSGDLDIKDPKELAEYTRNLERKLVEKELQDSARQGMPSQEPISGTPPVATKSWEEECEEVFYTDPKQAIAKMRQGVLGDLRKEEETKLRRKKFWDDFYEENADLKELSTVVESVMMTKSGEISPMKIGDAKKFLAEQSRKIVAKIRGKEETRETLPEGGATTVTGGPTLLRGTQPPAPPKNFVEQVASMQDRRRTKH